MSILTLSRMLVTIAVALLCAMGVLIMHSFDIQDEIIKNEQHRLHSRELMYALVQNAEDLTLMARSYVATGDPGYQQHYFEILNIRDGRKPRPKIDSPTYWYLAGIGKAPPAELGETVSIQELMRRAGFTEQELKILKDAHTHFDHLIRIEKQAFSAMNGLYDDGHGTFTQQGPVDRNYASSLLYGKNYIDEKAEIMSPIQNLLDTTFKGDKVNLNASQSKLHKTIIMLVITVIIALIGVTLFILYSRRAVLNPLVELNRQADKIAQGNYTARCTIHAKNELSKLGEQFNSMAEAIERDIAEHLRVQDQLRLAASVFTHAREGITITDAQGTIIDTNDAFSQITGYSRDEAVGKNPRILKSGRQNTEYYATMWHQLTEQGHWYGEIWNRRKSGEVYAEMITISAVKDTDGRTQNYVALFNDITPIKQHQQQLERIAHYDALTGLPNRVLLADRMEQAMIHSLRRNHAMAVLFIDLDGFKAVNDTHGHEVGDELLITVSQRMKTALREGDTLARIGGDEFVAVLVDLEQPQDYELVLERLLIAASDAVIVGEAVLHVSASIGVTLYPQDGADADQLMRHADHAMYQAKQSGKNRYWLFDSTSTI